MFTNLFNLTKKAVTVFSSSDKGAPTLTNDAGSLKTLLKACLVTGYGDKKALGWQMKYETDDQTSAVFISADKTSSGYHFKVDNTDKDVKLSVYRTMTAFDAGQNPMVVGRIYRARASQWRLIGHEKAFILLLNLPVKSNGSTPCAYPIIFGDAPSQSNHVAPNCVFWSASDNGVTNYYQGVGGVQSTLFYNKNGYLGRSGIKDLSHAYCHPFLLSSGTSAINIKTARCRFDYQNMRSEYVLYEPILFTTNDGSWSLLPHLMPVSGRLEQANLGMLDDKLMLARTGWYSDDVENGNNDCVIATDFWWA